MVKLSKEITNKIRDKQGEITEDEVIIFFTLFFIKWNIYSTPSHKIYNIILCIFQTVRFKSYLLSLGIPDPVTRETHGSGDKYFKELAKQISSFMETPLKVT